MKIKDWSGRLIGATVLVTIVRYMGAFAAADLGKISGVLSEILTIFLALSGAGMGLLDVLGGGLLFNGWRLVMPRAGQRWSFRFWVLTFCVLMLLISGSIILVPFTVSRMTQNSIVDTLGGPMSDFTWLWAWMVVLVPYFIIIGVFVGNRMVEGLETSGSSGTTSETTSRRASIPIMNSETPSRSGRPSLHDSAVFSYMEEVLKAEGRIATFSETVQATGLPESTVSRLRKRWIEEAQRQANQE